MREKARIKRILKLIERIWEEVPDQRLGQLLINYGFIDEKRVWFIEDDTIEANLKTIISKFKIK